MKTMVLNTNIFYELDSEGQQEWLYEMKDRGVCAIELESKRKHQFKWDNTTKNITTKHIKRNIRSTVKEQHTIDGYDTLPFVYEQQSHSKTIHISLPYIYMSDTSKETTIEQIYENPVTGYGYVNDTFKQAYKIGPSIKLSDVREHLNKYQHSQTQFQYNKHNSFVSPHPLFEIEIVLVDMSTKASVNEALRYGFVGIDNVTKYAWVVPITKKQKKTS